MADNAEHSPPGSQISLFEHLRSHFGTRVDIFDCTKATLVHVSHTMEDLILRERMPAVLLTGFQESSHWRAETERYRALADIARQVCIFSGGQPGPDDHEREIRIRLLGSDPLRQEWFVCILAPALSVVLCGQDHHAASLDESARRFATFWSFDPDIVHEVLGLLEDVVAHYRPERLAELRQAREQLPPVQPDVRLISQLMRELIRFEDQLQTRLRERETRYRIISELITDQVYTIQIDAQNQIGREWAADAFGRITGYSDQELAAMPSLAELIHPDDLTVATQGLHVLLAGQTDTRVFRVISKAGQVRWVRSYARPICDRQRGKVSTIVGAICDITEQKHNEEALRAAELQYRMLIEHVPAIIYTASIDEHSSTSYVSPQIYEILGFTPEEWMADPQLWFRQIHPDDRAQVLADIEQAHTGSSDHTAEYRAFTRDGAMVWLRDTARIVYDAEGRPLFLQGITLDISQRRQAEDARAQLAAIVDSSGNAIVSTDMDGRITSWNPGAEQMCGYRAKEMLGQSVLRLVPPSMRVERLAEYQRFKESKQIVHNTTIWRHRDGRMIDVALTISPIANSTDLSGFAVIAYDITEQKHAEAMLAQARDQALEASRLKSEFLATMSHEIRTPMNGIIGMAELLLDTELSSDQREFAGVMRDSAQALLTIINDILDFSKIEAGKLALDHTDFGLLAAVEGVADLLAQRAREKGLALMTFVDPNIPPILHGDAIRLRQVLMNLAGNAIKFTERGEVLISANLVSSSADTIELRFAVRDTGIGISKQQLQRLFQPFTQADSSVTRKYGGTGLGLAISQRLVELMGGAIGVESHAGSGSTFWFTLRLARAAAKGAAYPRSDLSRQHVLVINDQAPHRDILQRYLDAWEIANDSISSSTAALALLRQAAIGPAPYTLVLIDLAMPQLDAFAFARALREDRLLADIHMILITPFSERSQGADALQAGFAAYLTRPIKQSQLLDAIVGAALYATPAAPAPAPAPAPVPAPAPACPSSQQILLVEDNLVNQRLALRQLEKLGFSASTAANGHQAIACVQAASSFALILMDCQMPEMDGFAATRAIRDLERDTGQHIPIIAMTANAMQGDREACLSAGMDDYLSKPVRQGDLQRILEQWLPQLDTADG